MKFFLPLTLFLIPLASLFAQSKRQWVKYGDLSFSEKDYYGAAQYYGEGLKTDTTDTDLLNKYCQALKGYNDYVKAETFYAYLFQLDSGINYPEALFWMASMQKYNGKYEAAKSNFLKFLNTYKNKEEYIYKKASNEIASCDYAIQLKQDTVPVRIINTGAPVNSEYADFGSLLVGDSVMIFSSLRKELVIELKGKKSFRYPVQLYLATGKDTSWDISHELDSVINNRGFHVANGSFNESGNIFYFSSCNSDYRCKIYRVRRDKEKWKNPELLPPPFNLDSFTTTQPMVAKVEGREVIFFVSDRPGGVGNLDIWYSVKESRDVYSDPVNLGPVINTIDDEVSPWYDNDNGCLYFSSAGHFGLGGFDIFSSKGNLRRQEPPVNLGYPINSSANDFYFSLYNDKRSGFLSSNRVGSMSQKAATCCNDIWYFEYIPRTSPILEEVDSLIMAKELSAVNRFLPLSLYFHNDSPGARSLDTIAREDYKQLCQEYLKMKEHYLSQYSADLEGDSKEQAVDQVRLFFETKVQTGFENLEAFVRSLSAELQKGRNLVIAVRGYASPLANSTYNINLSKRRISSFINYLKNYESGRLLPYLSYSAENGGSLEIIELPVGEYDADASVSDDLNFPNHSIYSPAASSERRIEILYVADQSPGVSQAVLKPENPVCDFGIVEQGKIIQGKFVFRNVGSKELTITNVKTECGCTAAYFSTLPVAPGATGEITFTFNTSGKMGKQIKRVILETDGLVPVKQFVITGEVIGTRRYK